MKKICYFLFLLLATNSPILGQNQQNIESLDLATPSNRTFKCSLDGKDYFFRIGREHPELIGISREREIRNFKIGEELGIAPAILGFEVDNGLLITEFIEGTMPTVERLHDLNFRNSVVHNFHLLHSYPVDSNMDVEKNMFEVCRKGYKEAQHLLENDDEALVWLKFLESFERGYYDGVAKAYCHGDIYFGNLLETSSGKVYFIDWEYAFFGYVIDDLGKFCSDALTEEEVRQVVEEYWGDSEMLVKMKQNAFMHSLCHFFWCHIQAEHNPDNTWYAHRIALMRDELNGVLIDP